MSSESTRKIQVGFRVDTHDIEELERIGAEMKPAPLNRSVMISIAIREYLERHRAGIEQQGQDKAARKRKQGG